ncbi:MAG: excalibur calcium-binding domain-containing protein [Burkholderiales bacterium]|nr:excalibur calcium-binding domain-containing protein [Burkholderiales bacterium]
MSLIVLCTAFPPEAQATPSKPSAADGQYSIQQPSSSQDRKSAGKPVRSFRNCSEARAAGAAPIRRGEPGYAPHLDRDGDGVACEPYRGRR